MTAAQTLLWDTAGRPDVPGAKAKLLTDHPAVCTITGEPQDITADVTRALGENFTDHSLWSVPSGRVGPAALWCCSGKGATSPRTWTWVCTPGRELPDSHPKAPYRAHGLCLTNRADPRPIIDTLLNPTDSEWVIAVAVSGQKHVLPYARTNRGRQWTVRMEDTTITADSDQWAHVFGHVLALRRLGVPGDDIKAGTPGAYLKTADQVAAWRHHSTALATHAGAPITDLALWCATKPILEDTCEYPNP